MFTGTYYNSIDNKNRMIVPSKCREQLGTRCVLTKAMDNCLDIYSMENWQEKVDKLAKLPESDPKVRAFIRHFCGNAVECEFDKQGRITIPAELKAYAAIDKELVTIGAMSKIEVWGKEKWQEEHAEDQVNVSFAELLQGYDF